MSFPRPAFKPDALTEVDFNYKWIGLHNAISVRVPETGDSAETEKIKAEMAVDQFIYNFRFPTESPNRETPEIVQR